MTAEPRTSDVTVVIPAYNDSDSVKQLLAALAAQAQARGTILHVVVSDDASPRPLEDEIAGDEFEALELRIIRSERNGGPGAARNRALRCVETEWLAFLDSDEIPREGWLSRLEEILSSPVPPDGVEGRVEVGAMPSPFAHVGLADTSTLRLQLYAGNLVLRTAALRDIDGFDERFYDPRRKLHFREDVELHFRLHAADKRLVFDDRLVVDHPPVPPSFSTPIRQARRYYFDPLLSREHPDSFRAFVRLRTLGPIPLRLARHLACLVFVSGMGGLGLAAALRRRRLGAISMPAVAVGWSASAAALGWKRRITGRDVLPLMAVAAIVPFVYVRHYYEGVIRFRHRPRL